MNRFRPLVSVLAGLMLLVQGFAVAAGPTSLTSASAAPAADVAMPCHGSGMADNGDVSCCCDGDCPDMASCGFGSLATAPLLRVDAVAVSQAFDPSRVLSPASLTPQSPLRPPISFHA